MSFWSLATGLLIESIFCKRGMGGGRGGRGGEGRE